jgi:snurportin-1
VDGEQAAARKIFNFLSFRLDHISDPSMIPSLKTDVPLGLNGAGTGEGWYVRPRPEGRRCLVTACNGISVNL